MLAKISRETNEILHWILKSILEICFLNKGSCCLFYHPHLCSCTVSGTLYGNSNSWKISNSWLVCCCLNTWLQKIDFYFIVPYVKVKKIDMNVFGYCLHRPMRKKYMTICALWPIKIQILQGLSTKLVCHFVAGFRWQEIWRFKLE